MEPRLRPATLEDLPALLAVHEAAFRALVEARYGWDPVVQRARFPAEGLGQAIEVAGELVGQWLVEEREEVTYLARVMLHPRVQGQGLGGRLIRQLQARGRAIELSVWEENPARSLYARLGFREASREGFRLRLRWEP